MRILRPLFAACLSMLLAAGLPTAAKAGFTVPPNAPGQYAPRDECSAQEGGARFLASLKAAVAARDANAFAALASPGIFLDFGGGGGHEAVLAMLGHGSEKWSELDRIMALGCAFDEDNGALVLPWFFNQNLGDADPYSTMVTLGSEVPLRARPSRRGRAKKVLNWQLIHVYEVEVDDPGYRTVAVIDANDDGANDDGYIRIDSLRSQLDYRLRAEKVDGNWRITAFIAGE